MIYVNLPDNEQRLLPFYLAMEEYTARELKAGDYFFMWQVEPTVIFGRNQLIETEVNLEYCRQHGIQTYRRKSGGGCVYADRGNVMCSYITADEQVNFTFYKYTNLLVLLLLKMGIAATASGRNDVLIDGKKVSGNAFYHLPGRSIVHGTMLYDTQMEHMVGAITPADEKLRSKGVQSVRQHITLLKDHTSLTLEEFKGMAKQQLCSEEITLGATEVKVIEEMMQEYLTEEFIYSRNPRYSIVRKKRMEGVGDIEVHLELKNGIIKNANILGDFFLVGDIDRGMIQKLKGVKMEEQALTAALPERLDDVILNLKKEDFIQLIINRDF